MAIALNIKEHEMLAAVIKEMGDLPSVDFAKVALVTGQKYPRNARSAFKRIWDKLKSGPVGTPGEGEIKPAKKTGVRATVKKSVGPKNAPRKSGAGGTGSRQKIKKEENEETDSYVKADCDDNSDDDIVTKTEKYEYDSGMEEDGASTAKNGSYSGEKLPELDDDETGAMLLGVSIEAYRELARQASLEPRDPTPTGPDLTDDDAA